MKLDWNLVEEILDTVNFYIDKYDRSAVYAEYRKAKGGDCFTPVDSGEFAAYIRTRYREGTADEVPDVGAIVQCICDDAIYYENLRAVDTYTRIAGNLAEGIEYFLANRQKHVVVVKDGEWSLSGVHAHKFLTSSAHSSQVKPVHSDDDIFELLAPCFNLSGDDLKLFVIWLIQGFSGGNHYGVVLSAERGSGKSTLTKAVNALLDPSPADAAIMPTRLEELQNFLANHYLACFDNLRRIPADYSDTLCTAITGGTVPKRKLYSDRSTVYLRLSNIVMLNGIGLCLEESDLAERFLYFELKKLSADKLRTDSDIVGYLESNRPRILGAIFNVLAKATVTIHSVNPKHPTRMVGAYKEMLAIANALDINEDEFHRLITQSIAKLHQACASTPLVEAVCEYMNGPVVRGRRKVVQSSTEFFKNVKANYSGRKNTLPSRAAEFSKRLKAEHDALQAAGFSSIIEDTGAAGSVITIIRNKT